MKKLLYLLFLLPLFSLASCHDDDDLPNVDVTVTVSNVAVVDGDDIYVVQGDTLGVDGVAVKGNGGKAAIYGVTYSLDGLAYVASPISPFGLTLPTGNLKIGEYDLDLMFDLLQEDKTPATAALDYDVHVVADKNSIPEGAEIGTYALNSSMKARNR